MRYRIAIKRSAQKEIASLPKRQQRRVMAAIAALALVPRPASARKLVGADAAYRIRVGDYRVVYQIMNRVLIVLVVRVRHRKDVYRRL